MDKFEIVNHSDIDYINLILAKVIYRTVHLHTDLEFLYVIDGSMSVITPQKDYLVDQNQFFFLNSNQSHEIKTSGHGVRLLCLQISPEYFTRYFPNGEMIYFEDCMAINQTDQTRFLRMRDAFLNLANTYVEQGEFYKIRFDSYLNIFLYEFLHIEGHQLLTQAEMAETHGQLSRLIKLLSFVDNNFRERIRLQDFADQEGLSMYYCSHFAKNTLHQTFQDYVTSLRLHYACTLLLNTEKKIIDVCEESGFSDSRYLYKAFKRAYNMTPYEYRDKYRSKPGVPNMTSISEYSLQVFYPRDKMSQIIAGITCRTQ